MKIIKKKTAYIFKTTPNGNYTMLLSHPYYSFRKHKINRLGIPVMYFRKINKDVRELFRDYKLVFRKPQRETMKSMQWSVLIDAYVTERLIMLVDKPYGTPFWSEAVDIYWKCIWQKAGIDITNGQDISKYTGLTAGEIYDLLVKERKTKQ